MSALLDSSRSSSRVLTATSWCLRSLASCRNRGRRRSSNELSHIISSEGNRGWQQIVMGHLYRLVFSTRRPETIRADLPEVALVVGVEGVLLAAKARNLPKNTGKQGIRTLRRMKKQSHKVQNTIQDLTMFSCSKPKKHRATLIASSKPLSQTLF